MSYILEALKQAEQERGSERLTKTLSTYQVSNEDNSSINWKKWLTIAIFINAVVLFVWVAWKIVLITKENDIETQTIRLESSSPVDTKPTVAEKSPVFSSATDKAPEKIKSAEIQNQVIPQTETSKPEITTTAPVVAQKKQMLQE